MKSTLDAARLNLALRLAPKIDVAHGKRTLERIARECGASKTLACEIASKYFRELRDADRIQSMRSR